MNNGCQKGIDLNQTTGDSYTCVPDLRSVRHAHEETLTVRQTCAQRTLPRLCPNVTCFDLGYVLAWARMRLAEYICRGIASPLQLRTLIFSVFFVLSLLSYPPAQAQPKPGDTVGQENWQVAKGFLPDSILRRFEDGSYRAKVTTLPSTMRWGSKFTAASESNAGKFSLDAEGVLIDNATQTTRLFSTDIHFPRLTLRTHKPRQKSSTTFPTPSCSRMMPTASATSTG